MNKTLIHLKAAILAFSFFFVAILSFIVMFFRVVLKSKQGRNINHYFADTFGELIRWVAGVAIDIRGRENIPQGKPVVMVGNHQSNLDLAFIGRSCPPNCVVIGKKEILWVPIFGLLFKLSGNIMIQRKKKRQSMDIINQVAEEIKTRQVSVCIFPEGTRNRSDQPLLPFKKGAFHMAIRAGVPILPVVSAPLKNFMDFKSGWVRKGTVKIQILPAISTQGMTDRDIDRLSDQVRNQMLEALKSMM